MVFREQVQRLARERSLAHPRYTGDGVDSERSNGDGVYEPAELCLTPEKARWPWRQQRGVRCLPGGQRARDARDEPRLVRCERAELRGAQVCADLAVGGAEKGGERKHTAPHDPTERVRHRAGLQPGEERL
jgi:hypothetical protein